MSKQNPTSSGTSRRSSCRGVAASDLAGRTHRVAINGASNRIESRSSRRLLECGDSPPLWVLRYILPRHRLELHLIASSQQKEPLARTDQRPAGLSWSLVLDRSSCLPRPQARPGPAGAWPGRCLASGRDGAACPESIRGCAVRLRTRSWSSARKLCGVPRGSPMFGDRLAVRSARF